jgi:hypothetical protein
MAPEEILLSLQDHLVGSYRFSCPECLVIVEKPADRKVMALLLSVGVGLSDDPDADGPGELEGPTHPPGPPFTVEDILEFRALLQDDERLYRVLPRP